MKNFMDLKPWQKCHELVVAIYRTSATFPEDDHGVVTEEVRGTVLKLEASIEKALLKVRPKGRGIPAPLDVANGKLARLESSLIHCKDVKYVDQATFRKLKGMVDGVQKDIDDMLGKRAVRARNLRQARFVKWANSITSRV